MKFPPPELVKEIAQILEGKPEATAFVIHYGNYLEMVDDLIDEPKDVELIGRTIALASDLFSSHYWQQHCAQLWLVEKLVHRQCMDSVAWEHSPEDWKRRDARCLSHAGYNMLFAVIQLEAGTEALRKISLRFREQAHLKHLHDPPITNTNAMFNQKLHRVTSPVRVDDQQTGIGGGRMDPESQPDCRQNDAIP
jgi:hypothetical protein